MFSPDKWFTNPSTGFYPHTINQSLRFEDGDSPQLTRTPSSAGNRQTWTLSCWVKRANLTGAATVIFSTANSSPGYTIVRFNSDNKLYFYNNTGYSQLFSDGVFRDTSAWYHIVAVQDSTNSTAADRMILYVNGEKIPQSYSGTYGALSQNFEGAVNNTVEHRFGAYNSVQYFDGYIAEVHLLDGIANDPTTLGLGEVKDGVWIPKEYSGSHGTNGFYLPFDDSSAIGDDESANTNDFTPSNLVASDVVPDSPTNNWCTFNTLAIDSSVGTTLSEGGLKVTPDGSGGFEAAVASFTLPRTGKWYWEYRTGAGGSSIYGRPSLITVDEYMTQTSNSGEISGGSAASNPNGVLFTANDGGKRIGDSDTSHGSAVSAGDIIGNAYDADTGQWFIYINNSIQASGAAISESIKGNLAGKDVYILHERFNGGGGDVYNFGQDSTFAGAESAGGNADASGKGDFAYAPPSGYLALCASNLPDITIGPGQDSQADDHFNTVIYTGDDSTQAITGVGFLPDFVWIKNRSQSSTHRLYNSLTYGGPVSAGSNTNYLASNSTSAETASASTVISLNSDGFTVHGSGNDTNDLNENYVAWNWKAGGSASSNSNGSITSSVSANTAAGFSIVSYTGTGANATVGHGLSSAPEVILVKNRSDSENWVVGHEDVASDPWTDYLRLNSTMAASDSVNMWNDTAPTSTVFTVGPHNTVNGSSDDMIAYCFHSVPGYQTVGSYVGNGSSDGTFVFTGFRPAWVIIKRTDNTGSWNIADSVRSTDNEVDEQLQPNLTNAESTTFDFDFLSNGFKARTTDSARNASGGNYVYLAIAEAGGPFKFSNAR